MAVRTGHALLWLYLGSLRCVGALSSGPKLCDAIGVCGGNACPEGMHLVGAPKRTAAYAVETDGTSYFPGSLVQIRIRVAQPTIQKQLNAGTPQCECSSGKGRCGPNCDCGAKIKKCKVTGNPFMESSKYIGLLVYAVKANDPTEEKVGTWELPDEDPPRFGIMQSPSCDGRAIAQISAQPKRFRETFWFRAPAAGTGKVVFRVLLKQGDTNGGAFYWPTAGNGAAPPQNGVIAGDLTLDEIAPVAQAVEWIRGALGATCDVTCAAAGRTCDALSFGGDASSATGLLAKVSSRYLCAPPLLASCDPSVPAASGLGDGWCWYADPGACTPASATTPSLCAASSAVAGSGLRFCPCRAGAGRRLSVRATGPAPSLTVGRNKSASPNGSAPTVAGCPFAAAVAAGRDPPSAAASRCPFAAASATGDAAGTLQEAEEKWRSVPGRLMAQLSAGWALAVCTAVGLTGTLLLAAARCHSRGRSRAAARGMSSRRLGKAAAHLGLLALDGASAHNWINAPRSRASKASTVSPCLSRNGIHVRANPGQDFLIEWASGHPGSYHYFVVLKASDEEKMSKHTEALLEDYLDGAPQGAGAAYAGVGYRKMHYGWTKKSRAGGDEPSHANFGKSGLTSVPLAAAEYAPRPAAFACANYGSVKGKWETGDCEQVSDLTLYNYPAAAHATDKRVAYANPKYGWIEAVHRFKAIKPTPDKNGFPKQFDTTRFSIPARGGAGEYIVQYFWRGCARTRPLPTHSHMRGRAAHLPARTRSPPILGPVRRTPHCRGPV